MDKRKDDPTSVARRQSGEPAERSAAGDIARFLDAARTLNPAGAGRLIFALDATMSRQPSWDRACQIQGAMFDAVGNAGSLSVQLVYFRGMGECRASRWVMNTGALRDLMLGIQCRGGTTQIGKVLSHARRAGESGRIGAVVYIGDAMEEDPDQLCRLAGELGLRGTRVFAFQEGGDAGAEACFREIARLSGGAWFRLGPDSSRELAQLLGAVAVYAHGGLTALEKRGDRGAKTLLSRLPPPGRAAGA